MVVMYSDSKGIVLIYLHRQIGIDFFVKEGLKNKTKKEEKKQTTNEMQTNEKRERRKEKREKRKCDLCSFLFAETISR